CVLCEGPGAPKPYKPENAWRRQVVKRASKNHHPSVISLIRDLSEGGSLPRLLDCPQRRNSQQVKLLGLAALDDEAQPVYDSTIAQKLADRGMQVAALTPEHFAQWLAEVMQ
ncbi:VWA domain-containing protein, partial [Proteus mirabilis]